MTVAPGPFAVNVPVPENGVAPERVSVPVPAPVFRVRVAVAPPALGVKVTVPPTLTEPELKANVALLFLLPLIPATLRPPEMDKLEIVEVKIVVSLPLSVKVVVLPTETDAQLIVPAPAIVAPVLEAAAF